MMYSHLPKNSFDPKVSEQSPSRASTAIENLIKIIARSALYVQTGSLVLDKSCPPPSSPPPSPSPPENNHFLRRGYEGVDRPGGPW